MKVKLRVLQGKRAGKEVAIPNGKFLVGRSEQCQLRPKSDSISRKHCQITVKDDTVKVKDLESRNGTFVNGEKITSAIVESGDRLRIGKLDFQVLIESESEKVSLGDLEAETETNAQASTDQPTRIIKPGSLSEEDDISDWLEEGDESDRAQKLADPGTRQFMMDVTKKTESPEGEKIEGDTKEMEAATKEKKEPGKLPKLPTQEADTSRDAAADMLKKFFNRR